MKTVKKCTAMLLAVSLALTLPLFSFAASVFLGDADMDGAINVNDARKILRYAVKLDSITDNAKLLCDIDENGTVDVNDARIVLRHSVKLQTIKAKQFQIEIENKPIQPNQTSEADLIGDLSKYPLPTVPTYETKHGYFTFVVYGDGHGIGLPQLGVVFMAQKGCSYEYILSHYFPDTRLYIDESFPEKTTYLGVQYDTIEILCRMVAQEIGGIQPPVEALKAQTVAIYTLLKKNNFNVVGKWDVATVADTSSWLWTNQWCQNTLIPTVLETVGQFLARKNDAKRTPINTVYCRMSAGATVNCADEWYDTYPVSVKSPFEMTNPDFVKLYRYSAQELKEKLINNRIVSVDELEGDPSTWIKILSHTASIDKDRGYVKDIRVGKTVFSKVGNFSGKMGFRSGCFTVEYTK